MLPHTVSSMHGRGLVVLVAMLYGNGQEYIMQYMHVLVHIYRHVRFYLAQTL